MGLFPFQGDTWAWAGLRGGKALGVTKPVFPPRAPPFRARRCSALWYGVVYWQIPVCCCIGGVRLSQFFSAGRKAVCAADLFLVVVLLLALICSCLLYCWCSLAPVCCRITGIDLLLPVAVLTALTCSRLLLYCRRSPASVCCRITGIDPLPLTTGNRPAARAAFPSGGTKKSAQPDATDTAAYRTKPIN